MKEEKLYEGVLKLYIADLGKKRQFNFLMQINKTIKNLINQIS